jgi:hypothetical protein
VGRESLNTYICSPLLLPFATHVCGECDFLHRPLSLRRRTAILVTGVSMNKPFLHERKSNRSNEPFAVQIMGTGCSRSAVRAFAKFTRHVVVTFRAKNTCVARSLFWDALPVQGTDFVPHRSYGRENEHRVPEPRQSILHLSLPFVSQSPACVQGEPTFLSVHTCLPNRHVNPSSQTLLVVHVSLFFAFGTHTNLPGRHQLLLEV